VHWKLLSCFREVLSQLMLINTNNLKSFSHRVTVGKLTIFNRYYYGYCSVWRQVNLLLWRPTSYRIGVLKFGLLGVQNFLTPLSSNIHHHPAFVSCSDIAELYAHLFASMKFLSCLDDLRLCVCVCVCVLVVSWEPWRVSYAMRGCLIYIYRGGHALFFC